MLELNGPGWTRGNVLYVQMTQFAIVTNRSFSLWRIYHGQRCCGTALSGLPNLCPYLLSKAQSWREHHFKLIQAMFECGSSPVTALVPAEINPLQVVQDPIINQIRPHAKRFYTNYL